MKQTTLSWSSPKKPEDPSPLIRRSFSQIWSEPGEALEVEEEILEESLQEALHKKRKWEPAGTWRRKTGGRQPNWKLGLQSRGTAGGWGSNRLYAGMERRRKDWSAAEGVEICKKVLDLQAGGTDAAEVNKYLLKHCRATANLGKRRGLESVKNVLKKGLKFWTDRQKRVQVGKHGLRKKGATLKRVCRTSESHGVPSSWRWSEGPLPGLQSRSEEGLHGRTGERAGGWWSARTKVTGRSTWPSS